LVTGQDTLISTPRLAIKQASQAGKPWLAGLKLFTPKAGLLGLIGPNGWLA